MAGSITAISIAHLARAVAAVGGDPRVLGEHAARNVRYEDRIPVGVMIELWESAVASTGRRDLPVVAAAYTEPDTRSLISFVVANQPRLGDGIDRFDRYAPTVSDAYRWSIVDDTDAAALRVLLSHTGPIHRLGWQCYLEFEMLDMVRSVHRLTDQTVPPSAIRFLHAVPPVAIAAYAELCGLTPEAGAPCTELVYPRSVRELAVPRAQPALAGAIATQLDAMLEAIERGTVVSARARAAIGVLLERGAVGVDELARALAMSRRSLERALADEDTSAAALIEDERKQRALAWLPALSVEEVAARLGYSDARAFARAFKRWTGVPPSAARR